MLHYRQFEKSVYEYLVGICGPDILQLRMPLLLNVVLQEASTGDPDSIFAVAVQLRRDPLFADLRSLFSQFNGAAGTLNVPLMATVKRQFEGEAERLAAAWNGTLRWSIDVKLKFAKMPVDVSFDARRWFQGRKDVKIHAPIANLSRLTETAFFEVDPNLKKFEGIVGVRVPHSEVSRICTLTAQA